MPRPGPGLAGISTAIAVLRASDRRAQRLHSFSSISDLGGMDTLRQLNDGHRIAC
jgi:hypothetical protein